MHFSNHVPFITFAASRSERRRYCGARRLYVALCVCVSAEPRLCTRDALVSAATVMRCTQCSLVLLLICDLSISQSIRPSVTINGRMRDIRCAAWMIVDLWNENETLRNHGPVGGTVNGIANSKPTKTCCIRTPPHASPGEHLLNRQCLQRQSLLL